MKNSRAAERFPIVLRIEVKVAGEEAPLAGNTRNISIGGTFIDLGRTLALGTRVTLKFKLPAQNDAIEVGGVVRWTDIGGFGVQFDGLRARDVWALGKLFEKNPANG